MRFDHIVFPIDFSERSRALNGQVEWLASRFGSRVTLLHVFEIPMSWYGAGEASFVNVTCFHELRDSAEKRLKEYALKVPEERVERIFIEGGAASEILDWVDEHGADLIVMGTHGYGPVQGWILGSVTAKVLHRAKCPVWTEDTRHAQFKESGISEVLCALELTSEAVPLLRFTKELSQELGAAVRVIHSEPAMETRPNRYFDFDLHRYLMDSARVEIGKMQREAGTDFPLTISETGISSALAEAVQEDRCNLVVIGRGKTEKVLGRFQTHAYEIIRHATCPVLSYSLHQQDRISSSCSAEHLGQSVADEQLLTGSRKT